MIQETPKKGTKIRNNRGVIQSNTRTAGKDSLVTVTLTFAHGLSLRRPIMSGISPLSLFSSPLKTPAGSPSGTEGGMPTLCHQNQTRPSAAVTSSVTASPASTLSITNMLAVDMDHLF